MTDPKQFEVFMKHYQDMVYGTALRLLGNTADAEDVAQAVFLKVYERFHQIGASPTAVANTSVYLPDGVVQLVSIPGGSKIAAIQASATGSLYITEAA